MAREKMKPKSLYLYKILSRLTDEEHRLTMPAIIEELHKYQIPAERKGVYSDLTSLDDFFDACQMDECLLRPSAASPRQGYALVGRPFSQAEIKMIIDCIHRDRNISQKDEMKIIDTLLDYFASDYQRSALLLDLRKKGTRKSHNQTKALDIVMQAISDNKQILCKLYEFEPKDNHLARNIIDKAIQYSPLAINYDMDEDEYYITVYFEPEHGIDKIDLCEIASVQILDNPRVLPDEGYQDAIRDSESPIVFSNEAKHVETVDDIIELYRKPKKQYYLTFRCMDIALPSVYSEFGGDIQCKRCEDNPDFVQFSVHATIDRHFMDWMLWHPNCRIVDNQLFLEDAIQYYQRQVDSFIEMQTADPVYNITDD